MAMVHTNINDLKVAIGVIELRIWSGPSCWMKAYMNKYMQFPKMPHLSQEHFASWPPTMGMRQLGSHSDFIATLDTHGKKSCSMP